MFCQKFAINTPYQRIFQSNLLRRYTLSTLQGGWCFTKNQCSIGTHCQIVMMSDNHFFEALDAGFKGIDQASNEPLIWKCEGMSVQHRFELPIPSLAGSVCKYSFSTTIGDISFAVEYRCKGRPDEKIFENSRVPSDQEPIAGTFKSVREGTLIFIFDNTFSWYNPKVLTYRIELFQVS